MTLVVVNKETGGKLAYPDSKNPWTPEQAEARAKKANDDAALLGLEVRYEARDVEEWRS